MGIKGLAQLLETNAPSCIVKHEMNALFGRKVAIDASMSLYQFMVAVRTAGNASDRGGMAAPAAMLMNEDGEVTSHLQGLFYRTIRMMENGVKPCYVFDGTPPKMKADELAKRSERRGEAQEKLEKATEEANVAEIDKANKRLVKVSPEHNAEAKKLLTLMGVPVVQAAGEAEAQCAALAKAGKVYATATEDMDALTFGSPVLLRHMTFSAARKLPIAEFQLDKALSELGITMDQVSLGFSGILVLSWFFSSLMFVFFLVVIILTQSEVSGQQQLSSLSRSTEAWKLL
jgi:flap endonuclease-1